MGYEGHIVKSEKQEGTKRWGSQMFSYRITLYNNGLNFDKSFPNELEVHNLNSYGAIYKLPLSHKNV